MTDFLTYQDTPPSLGFVKRGSLQVAIYVTLHRDVPCKSLWKNALTDILLAITVGAREQAIDIKTTIGGLT